MRRHLRIFSLLAVLILGFTGCNAIKGLFNPFAGTWKSGMIEVDFRSDKTFKFVIGSTISVNLKGDYTYDDDTIVLSFDSGSDVTFSYEFKENKNKLVLIPQTDFDYINTRIELTRE